MCCTCAIIKQKETRNENFGQNLLIHGLNIYLLKSIKQSDLKKSLPSLTVLDTDHMYNDY